MSGSSNGLRPMSQTLTSQHKKSIDSFLSARFSTPGSRTPSNFDDRRTSLAEGFYDFDPGPTTHGHGYSSLVVPRKSSRASASQAQIDEVYASAPPAVLRNGDTTASTMPKAKYEYVDRETAVGKKMMDPDYQTMEKSSPSNTAARSGAGMVPDYQTVDDGILKAGSIDAAGYQSATALLSDGATSNLYHKIDNSASVEQFEGPREVGAEDPYDNSDGFVDTSPPTFPECSPLEQLLKVRASEGAAAPDS